jgi:type II secretion system protein N
LHGDAPTGGGRATVRVTADSWSGNGAVSVAGRIEHLPLSLLSFPAARRGRLSADFTQRWEGTLPAGDAADMEGTWTIDMADVAIEPIVSGQIHLPSVTLAHARMTLQCRAAVCRIQEFSGDGADGFFQGDGQITVRRPFRNSTLALSVAVTPSPAFAQRTASSGMPVAAAGVPMKVRISGTWSRPQVAF